MAEKPTIYIVASDATRNGKTLLARLIADYLLLEGRDPFLIDTDGPDGHLRQFFPGRTVLADLAKTTGVMKAFDTILAGPGRDYVIDLPQRHLESFIGSVRELEFFAAARAAGFRIFLFYIVDLNRASRRAAEEMAQSLKPDLLVAVKNENVGSSWPEHEAAIDMPPLARALAVRISDKRFSLSRFVLGDRQGLSDGETSELNRFLVPVLEGLSGVDVQLTLGALRS